MQVFKGVEKLNNSQNPIEFSGTDSIPIYDMSPIEKRKCYLSDSWAEIMKDSVGFEFVGGAAKFRLDLINTLRNWGSSSSI